MADDKGGGGGGSGWGTFEIVLGILLAIGLLDRLTSVKSGVNSSPTATPAATETASTCGLTLETPRATEKVRTSVVLKGSVGTCDWKATEKVALYAQLVDSKGKVVSKYLAIPPQDTYSDIVTFSSTITLTSTPASGTGYLILVPAVSTGNSKTVSARIPLSFSK